MSLSSKISFALGFATLAIAASATAAEYAPGEVIVKYKAGALRTRTAMNAFYDANGVAQVHHFPSLLRGVEHLVLNAGVKVEEALQTLRRDPAIEWAQPNYLLHTLPMAERALADAVMTPPPVLAPEWGWWPWPSTPAKRPDLADAPADIDPPQADPLLSETYGLDKIGATDAWKTFRGSKDIIVADIDTGIDYNHEDLAFNIWRNPNPGPKQDIVGYDFIHDDGLPFDDNEHGTHTAGTIGAVGGNGKGISGVAPRVSIMAIKFIASSGSGTTTDAIRAIDYGTTHGAKIMSNSWGGPGDASNPALLDAVNRARAAGILFVAAAGNDGADNDGASPSIPASFPSDNVISVAATDKSDTLAYFSNYGLKSTHLAAPGNDIYSTVPGNKYKSLSGTSMACPHVAGAAAMVWAMHPTWTYLQVKAALLNSVDALPSLAGKTISGGRLNVLKAINQTDASVGATPVAAPAPVASPAPGSAAGAPGSIASL